MPAAEMFSLNKRKMMNNSTCLKNEIRSCNPQKHNGFLVEFNEDGTPIDCHKFIRLPSHFKNQETLRVNFKLPDAFLPESSIVSVEIQRGQEMFSQLKFDGDLCEIEIKESGTFKFYLISGNKCYTPGFIQIPPNFIHQDNIKLITLVSKWMGSIDDWENYYEAVKKLDYNMIHFTPLQQRGMSDSPYSIKDQLKLSINGDEKDLEKSLKIMNEKHEIFGMTDIVWNHTACDSDWLFDHPEAGYNLENSPHLKVAFELDENILKFSSNLSSFGLNGELKDENYLLEMMKVFKDRHLPKSRLWEFFVINVSSAERELEEFIEKYIDSSEFMMTNQQILIKSLKEAEMVDGNWDRFSNQMSLKSVSSFYCKEIESIRSCDRCQRSQLLSDLLAAYRKELDQLNLEKYQKYDEIIEVACRNIFNRASYERIADHGPKIGSVSSNLPLVPTYFTRVPKSKASTDCHALANNGWIWNADPFNNFAESNSQAYLRREVIIWGDCVKLRYGPDKESNPWLWDHMAEYTRRMARIFHAFRIDNCHSTPIHVACYLLKEARNIRPDLYVCAELFTGSEEKDMRFVTSLGINSLIREAMVAWNSNEITRLVLTHGGSPIGSFQTLPENLQGNPVSEQSPHIPSRPHNIFFDCTHDNEPPAQKRTVADTLSNSAIVCFSRCATGSTFGYDQLVPHHVNVVEETRKYDLKNVFSGSFSGIKSFLNSFHSKLIEENCSEIFAKSYSNGIVLISLDNPDEHEGYTLLTRTAYNSSLNEPEVYDVIDFPGCDIEIVCSAHMIKVDSFQRDPQFINGLNAEISFELGSAPSDWFSSTHNNIGSLLELKRFPAGSFIILKRRILEPIKLINVPFLKSGLNCEELKDLACKLDLVDMNYVLYRCDEEERDEFPDIGGIYSIPGYGPMSYCGIEGTQNLLAIIKRHSALDHPLCENLRQGCWLFDYTLSRLERSANENVRNLIKWMNVPFSHLKELPGYLRPKYVIKIFETISEALKGRVFDLMNPRLKTCGEFAKKLALGSVQMIGKVPSTGLEPVKGENPSATLCAGLPHFTTNHMRCWGRDIFISFRGLLLIPGRFDIARAHLLAFAGCVYRGLIPNLLDSARRPRYNARDSTWWFMQALQDYCKYSPEGYEIFNQEVPLRFPIEGEYIDFDDSRLFSKSKTVKEIVSSIMESHARGIHFREWNAGPGLDSVMRSEGFQIDIEVDWRTGFIHGGNRWNCGTWMDKMGESELAGNRGIPTTPRDGAAIEITALLKSTLEWLTSLKNLGFIGVKCSKNNRSGFVTFDEWSELIQESFEREYFIESGGYYKDTVGSSDQSCDQQMRPNYLMAMATCPGVFDVRHARVSLATAERNLTGPLGMKTLPPTDPAYRPNYDNSLDCTDPTVAKGSNYHQGPEWLWCMGFYLRAWLTFNLSTADTRTARKLVLKRLQPHRHLLRNSPAAGLPELTNENGRECRDSCWTQAWSMACLLEVVTAIETEK